MYSVNSYLHTALETAAGTSKEKDNEPFFSYPVLARVGKMKSVALQSYLVCPLWKSCMDEEKGRKNHCTFITMCMKKERDEVFFFPYLRFFGFLHDRLTGGPLSPGDA